MVAVTADTTTLPRVAAATLGDVERPVLAVSSAPAGTEGEGFPVRRTMVGIDYRHLDPFIMMDHMGEVDYAAGEPKGTDWHPHRGFETVTYLIEGQFIHQDTHGGGGVITEGSTQWMTAGAGLLHIETPPEKLVEEGGLFHGFQLWVNLPAKDKFLAPNYQGIESGQITLLASADGGSLVRVIAGEVDGHRGPGSTHTPITLLHASLSPGAQLSMPWQPTYNALAYVMAGTGTVGPKAQPIHAGQLAVFGTGDRITLSADARQDSRTSSLEVILLGGEPIREPMAHYGPFVMPPALNCSRPCRTTRPASSASSRRTRSCRTWHGDSTTRSGSSPHPEGLRGYPAPQLPPAAIRTAAVREDGGCSRDK